MPPQDNTPDDPDLLYRPAQYPDPSIEDEVPPLPSRLPRNLTITFVAVLVLLIVAFYGTRIWARNAMRDSLPQLDGSVAIPGLSAPVTVQRDTHGVPYIKAASLDNLIVAQGFVTAQDRLWQMEALRRHGSGTLAELLGSSLLAHDRAQRTLQLRAAADRALTVLPPDQLHWLELYARGVNASIAVQRPHLPLEFRLLHDDPAPWTPSDSILISIVMYQDLTTTFSQKLGREILATRLNPTLLNDLFPVGSWRDHPPAQPPVDLTAPQPDIPDVPLDESQTKLTRPTINNQRLTINIAALINLRQILNPQALCESCTAGSNNWTVSGAHTASGKPLLSNDMHLNHSVPGIWYETSLEAPNPSGAPFHVAGVSLPGAPFVIVGHNDHIAWGFTNLGADVQDIYVEHTRLNNHQTEFQSPDGSWHPIIHHQETIHVRFGKDVVLDLLATQHGQFETPIISTLLNNPSSSQSKARVDNRPLALAWTIYDPTNLTDPFFSVNNATDWPSLLAAFSNWGGPAQNLVYADDQGHIGYHTLGKIPIRGSDGLPHPLSPFPVSGLDPNRQWSGYIPFEQLPQIFDPPGGILATANARITPDLYPFPITLDWGAPYRNERIWKVLSAAKNLTPADMLKLQTDVYSDLDHVLAQRFAYAIDHAGPKVSTNPKRLHQAADILRKWNGFVDTSSPAATIVDAARSVFWPMILTPKTGLNPDELAQLYVWYEKPYAEEQIILHAPARWLPTKDAKWNDLLATAVDRALVESRAPEDLTQWTYGKTHTVDIEHPVYSISPLIQSVIGVPTGTGPQPQSGDGTTVKQVSHTFGPSERLTVDFSDLDHTTLNIVLGQSGNPLSPWFMDQFPAWYHNTTNPLPYTPTAIQSATTHTLTLTPQ
jgi:penicillin amidase